MRPSWDEYFIGLLGPLAARASCDRGQSSAVIVDQDNNIVSTGYVGAPSGLPDCYEAGHDLVTIGVQGKPEEETSHCVRTIHAEMNAILNAAKKGVPCKGATMYCIMVPCRSCAMAIIQSGIKRVVACYEYQRSDYAHANFSVVGIELVVLNPNKLY